MNEMTGLEFEIRGNVSSAISSLGKLENSLKRIRSIASGKLGLKGISSEFSRFAKALGKIDVKKLSVLGSAASGIKSLGKAMQSISEHPEALFDVIDYMEQLSRIDFTNIKEAADGIRAITASANAIGNIKEATAEAGKSGGFGSFAKTIAQSAKTIAMIPFKKAAEKAKNFAQKLGSVGAAFKRIVFYRMIRSVIREITEGFGEGIKNLYGWSQIADGRFAASMDRMATSLLYFKNSIGAAVAPLLNALAPALDYLIDKMVAFINVINQLFAKLTGASYWTKANKVATQYADNASAAGSAAKEALRYLAPFDELNVLPTDRGSGGGGGASDTDYSGMFETREAFNQEIADFAQMVKDAWVNGDWEDVGHFIGGKINDLIENKIDWEGAGIKTGKFINALFGVQYWTLDEINFTNLGNRIAEFLNSAISHVDWDIAGRLPVKKLTSIVDTILGALGGLDWGQIGRSISDYLKGALNEASSWLQSTDFSQIGKKIYNSIDSFLKNVDWSGIAKSVMTLLGSAIRGAVNLLSGFFGEMWKDIKTWWDTQIKGVSFADTVSNLWKALKSALGNINAWVENNIVDPFFDSLFGSNQGWETLQAKVHNFVANIYNSLVDTIKEKAPRIADWLNLDYMDTVEIPVKANMKEVKDNIPASQRLIDDMSANLYGWQRYSQWYTKGYDLMNITGYMAGWKRYSQWYAKGYNLMNVTGNVTSWKNSANGISVGGGYFAFTKALGGAFYGGRWHDIPQYASGGLPGHGSMFVAGEAGPELVGHINGRTEVLNASQIASAIAAGVSGASYSAPDVDGEVLYNAFLRALNDSNTGGDIYLDGEAIYRSVARRNSQNTRRTGVNAFA